MTLQAFLLHLSFAGFLFILAVILTKIMIERVRIMDVPNERSAHQAPIPKSGGISIVVTFIIGIIVIYVISDKTMIKHGYFFGFVLSSLLIAAVSFYDDYTNHSYMIKLLTQVVSMVAVMLAGIVVHQMNLPIVGTIVLGWIGYPLTLLWILGLTNAFNFMDGLDGFAGGVALIASVFFCYISYTQGSLFVYIICYTLIAGTLGFLVFNIHPARIFMGDVGSAFLGFAFAVLAVIAFRFDHSHTSFFVMPLLLFNFIYDTAFTFLRRLFKGENVIEAHRTHLYQLFERLGYGHRKVCYFHYLMCFLQGLAAIWMVRIPGEGRLFVFLPYIALQIIYTITIIRRSKKAGLIED
jgi:UDP-GlcNAc:undecaprenyl-phosphate/decaprenyl-phosphate GlcNAc-1-phosphate transferase